MLIYATIVVRGPRRMCVCVQERESVRVSQPFSKKGLGGWVYIGGFSSFLGVWRIIGSYLARLFTLSKNTTIIIIIVFPPPSLFLSPRKF